MHLRVLRRTAQGQVSPGKAVPLIDFRASEVDDRRLGFVVISSEIASGYGG